MKQSEFLDTLRRRLAGMPETEIDEVVADYTTHFADGLADGRSEEDIAHALGDPMRLARELRAEAGFRRWEKSRTPGNFVAVLFGFLALVAVDFIFLLPVLICLALFTLIAGIVAAALCIAGIVVVVSLGHGHHGLLDDHPLARIISGIGMLGFGVGGGALLILLVDCVVRMLGRFARLHYTLLEQSHVPV